MSTYGRLLTLKRVLVSVLAGLLLGVVSGVTWKRRSAQISCALTPSGSEVGLGAPPTTRRSLYVGVMTARKLLRTRAAAINQTWGQYAPGLEFYAASETSTNGTPEAVESTNLPLVSLPGTPDGYPPLKKFFRVLQYMAKHHIEEYNWFMRADDDCYVRIPELLDFLSQLDPSQHLYIGASGTGKQDDLDKIRLFTHELYCLGGPGTLYSRALLKDLAPHLEKCLEEATSYHDDAEVGSPSSVSYRARESGDPPPPHLSSPLQS